MQERTTTSITFPSSSAKDVLTDLLRERAQQMLATTIEAEVAVWIESHAYLEYQNGHRQVVRNGYLPERNITTGVGDLPVRWQSRSSWGGRVLSGGCTGLWRADLGR